MNGLLPWAITIAITLLAGAIASAVLAALGAGAIKARAQRATDRAAELDRAFDWDRHEEELRHP